MEAVQLETNSSMSSMWPTMLSVFRRQRWIQTSGYTHQARVENAFFRYKQVLGDRLRSRSCAGQVVETTMACNVLNRMTLFGRPESVAIGR